MGSLRPVPEIINMCSFVSAFSGLSVLRRFSNRDSLFVTPCGSKPWVFEKPGRFIDLPAEETFGGFDGLDGLLGDDFKLEEEENGNASPSFDDYSKVSREVRNACYSFVSIDPAPDPELVVLGETGAALTGIPHEAIWAGRSGIYGSQDTGATTLSQRVKRELALVLSGTRLLEGAQPFASCYGGHQFGNWAGQLGDGRVATLGEVRAIGGQDKPKGVAATWHGSLVEVRRASPPQAALCDEKLDLQEALLLVMEWAASVMRKEGFIDFVWNTSTRRPVRVVGHQQIQIKGIGKTPFSRGGDGKAVLGACLREYLFSEAFVGLGLGAAVAVSVSSTGEGAMIRDPDTKNGGALKRSPGAVLCRAAPSFLRFGSFQLPARRGEMDTVRRLADFCLRHLGPHLQPLPVIGVLDPPLPSEALKEEVGPTASVHGPDLDARGDGLLLNAGEGESCEADSFDKGSAESRNDYVGLLVAIVQATARMVASWQALGFCHGVLNTDNFTLLGLTLDFGPCSFMEMYDPAWSPNEGDSALRYTFQNQPDVSAWNCERLAEAFSSLVGVSGVAQANEAFSPAFDAAYTTHLQRKLGLTGMDLGSNWVDAIKGGGVGFSGSRGESSSDTQFVLRLFQLMSTSRTDFTDTWRALLDVPASSMSTKGRNVSLCRLQSDSERAVSRWDSPNAKAGAGRQRPKKGVSNRASTLEDADSDEDGMDITDEEALRPLLPTLKAAGATGEQMRMWATWTREFMTRIDSQGIGRSHPAGAESGRLERLQTMRSSSPAFVLRAAALEQALEAAEQGDMNLVHKLEERLSRPYAAGQRE